MLQLNARNDQFISSSDKPIAWVVFSKNSVTVVTDGPKRNL